MGKNRILYLKPEEHGYYERHQKVRRNAVQYLHVDTNLRHHPYALVHGVAVDLFDRPSIVLVQGKREVVYAEFTLVTGTRVVSWEEDLIVELWKLGVSLTVHSCLRAEVAERNNLRDSGSPMGWPALYEVAPTLS